MPRMARAVAPEVPHHITARGNRGLDVFLASEDRQQYLAWLAEYAGKHGLSIWAYCLMTNHVHLVAVPHTPDSIARTLRPVQMLHAQRVNARCQWRGHLWQERPFSCALDLPHLWEAVRYVERNPVRAGLVQVAEAYPWSSAPAHCGLRTDPVLSPDLPLRDTVEDWVAWLRGPEDEEAITRLRRRTGSGIPCGSDAFVGQMEELLGHRFMERGRGRPRKP